jgi:hypothetical protein
MNGCTPQRCDLHLRYVGWLLVCPSLTQSTTRGDMEHTRRSRLSPGSQRNTEFNVYYFLVAHETAPRGVTFNKSGGLRTQMPLWNHKMRSCVVISRTMLANKAAVEHMSRRNDNASPPLLNKVSLSSFQIFTQFGSLFAAKAAHKRSTKAHTLGLVCLLVSCL